MKFSFATLLLAGVSQVLAVPTNTTLSTRDNLTCGTTRNAVTSDCKKLLDSDFSLNYGRGYTCSYYEGLVWRRVKAYNPVCWGPGNCCIYTMGKGLSVDQVRQYGKELLKCSKAKEDRINGRISVPGDFLCISDGEGCGDCFDD